MPWIFQPHLHATLLGLLLLHLTPLIKAQQPPAWVESNQNYNSPMATALIVMIIVFFSVGFISVYLRHFLACFGIRPYGGSLHLGGGGPGRWMREPPRGLDPNIVNTFPTFLYSDVKVHRVGKPTPLECAICLNEFLDHEVLRLLPKCNHVFHPHCIGPWLASHVTCPVCRANLEIQVYNQRPHNELTSENEPELEPQPSNQIVRQDDHLRDVIVRVGLASPETQEMIKELSESGRMRLHRSHSTGHSLVENSDRFTLTLPEEVRNKLVNFNNLSGLPAAIISPRVGYRANSLSSSTTVSGKPDRWRFSMSPPFVSRPGLPKLEGCMIGSSKSNNVPTGILRSPIGLFKSMKSPNKSPINHVGKGNDIGERSSDRLWADRGPHDVELEGR